MPVQAYLRVCVIWLLSCSLPLQQVQLPLHLMAQNQIQGNWAYFQLEMMNFYEEGNSPGVRCFTFAARALDVVIDLKSSGSSNAPCCCVHQGSVWFLACAGKSALLNGNVS